MATPVPPPVRARGFLRSALVCCYLLTALSLFAADETKRSFDVRAGVAPASLKDFSEQAAGHVLYAVTEVAGVKTQAVKGEFTAREALNRMLAGTDLAISENTTGENLNIVRVAGPNGQGAAPVAKSGRPVQNGRNDIDDAGNPVVKLDTFEVFERKTLNMDKPRSQNDAQPYIVYDSTQIQSSQTQNLEEFFNKRLPMTTVVDGSGSNSQNQTQNGDTSSKINLRGLGSNQTLVLVDGRRLPSVNNLGAPNQADINGIPLAAIERIEVLPTTAGGIYGGSATGGVINIILKRSYAGADLQISYGNTFKTDVGTKRIDISAGFPLGDGKTQFMVTASAAKSNSLRVGDRDLTTSARALQSANYPGYYSASVLPPLGGTVNIRSLGGNLTLKPAYGGAQLGSTSTYIPLGYAGPATDSGAALVKNAGQYNLQLPNDYTGLRKDLINSPEMRSATLQVRHQYSKQLEVYASFATLGDLGSSYNTGAPNAIFLQASAPVNPFQQPIYVRFPNPTQGIEVSSNTTTVSASAGALLRLGDNWVANLDYAWGRSRVTQRSTNPTMYYSVTGALSGIPQAGGRPALNALQEQNAYPLDYSQYLLPRNDNTFGPSDSILGDFTLRLAGPLFETEGRRITVSTYIEHRLEKLRDAYGSTVDGTTAAPTYTLYPHGEQGIDSLYAETNIPILAHLSDSKIEPRLDLQLSGRVDRYRTNGQAAPFGVPVTSYGESVPLEYATGKFQSTNYTAGILFEPASGYIVRASFGTGFLPPTVNQVQSLTTVYPFSFGYYDPKRGGMTGPGVGGEGDWSSIDYGRQGLKPETSKSMSLGVVLNPKAVEGLRFSADFTQIRKRDELQILNAQYFINNEASFPSRIIRDMTPLSPQDVAAGYTAGKILSIDDTYINAAHTDISAIDLAVNYQKQLGENRLIEFYVLATRALSYRNQVYSGAPYTELVGLSGRPLKWRGNLGLNYDTSRWIFAWNCQYYSSYLPYYEFEDPVTAAAHVQSQGSDRIKSQSYHDVSVSFKIPEKFKWMQSCTLQMGIQNIFNTRPPVVATINSFGGYSPYGDPRLRRYTITFKKSIGTK